MKPILQIIRILVARYPHRFFYSVVGFIFALLLMVFGFWKTLAIIVITLIFYFVGLLSENGITFKEFIRRLLKR